MSPLINEGTDLVMRFGSAGGQTIVSAESPLTRLNYFDGKFLRADDLRREQTYVRQLVQLSNQGFGAGIVHGMDTVLDSGSLTIGPGLAVDSTGRTLLIGSMATLDIAALIEASRRIPSASPAGHGGCDGRRGGVRKLRRRDGGACRRADAEQLALRDLHRSRRIALWHGGGVRQVMRRGLRDGNRSPAHRRRCRRARAATHAAAGRSTIRRVSARQQSLVASAYFEEERQAVRSLISHGGLAEDSWCVGAKSGANDCVPLAVISRTGTATNWLDAWMVRRERMEAPAKRYWAWRMSMRPRDVFLAQVLQFQCQLHEVLGHQAMGFHGSNPDATQQMLEEVPLLLRAVAHSQANRVGPTPDAAFRTSAAPDEVALRSERIEGLLERIKASQGGTLLDWGIVELPPAGYLPVEPGEIVDMHVRRLLGDGLDLRFCIVRADFVPHALEEAQHMDRIPLTDVSEDRPEVDILVPDGELHSIGHYGELGRSLSASDTEDAAQTPQTRASRPDAARERDTVLSVSEDALKLIGKEIKRVGKNVIGFVEDVEEFVEGAPPPREHRAHDVVVKATTGWVLFHRRRAKRCAPPPPRQPHTPQTRLRDGVVADAPLTTDTRNALVIFSPVQGSGHVSGREFPAARVTFVDHVPDGEALAGLLKRLTDSYPVAGVSHAVLTPSGEPGVQARLQSVIDAFTAAGRQPPRLMGSSTLSKTDREQLTTHGHDMDEIDEVIFLEPSRR